MKLFNTLTQKKEDFTPIVDKKVGIYTCGPTVYDIAHIGNLRKYICDDLLYRTIVANGFDVKRVMNITDVDDKTIKKSLGKKAQFDKLTREYEENFFADLKELNAKLPDVITRATAYIDKMVDFVSDLLDKGFAYKASDGSIYFSIEKFKDYGKLSHLDKEGLKSGARVNQDEYDKENPADFALWKAWDESDGEIFWETKLGKGRPGWHIECSTMSMDTLGETIDIHTGGVDNIFPHHENEIAQSEAKSGNKFVNFWIHNEHLLVDGKKMSKSLNNFYTLKDIKDRGFSPLDFRYFIIGAHYRSKINFTWSGLEAAKNTRERLVRIASENTDGADNINEEYWKRFLDKVNDDINLPEALAVTWEMMRDENVKQSVKNATIAKMDEILGLDLLAKNKVEVPRHIADIAEKRKSARVNKDFKSSDILRKEIEDEGWTINDRPDNEYELVTK
jgi:cysteinyl-tRNA synthetase